LVSARTAIVARFLQRTGWHIKRGARTIPIGSVASLVHRYNLLGCHNPRAALTALLTLHAKTNVERSFGSTIERSLQGIAIGIDVDGAIARVVQTVAKLGRGRRLITRTDGQATCAGPGTRSTDSREPGLARIAKTNVPALRRAELRIIVDFA
jgi:hypothetical protein